MNFLVLTTRQHLPPLSYSSSALLEPGDVVLVPLQNHIIQAVVISPDLNNDHKYKLKEISCKIENIKISPKLLEFATQMAKYYIIDPASICKMILPINLKPSMKTREINSSFNINLPELNSQQD
ncbi:MAG: hypothetical protein SFT91_03820, partial [Rickettsiaceae bacterium]|nr:hypothetical protein [Rickettsiaceae bacterium]